MSDERSELDSLEELVDIAAEEISQAVMNRENLKPGSKFMGGIRRSASKQKKLQ